LGLREYLEATRKSSRNYQAQSFVYPRFTEMDNEEMFEMVAEWVLAEIKIPMLTECFQESFDLMNFCIEPKRNRKIRPPKKRLNAGNNDEKVVVSEEDMQWMQDDWLAADFAIYRLFIDMMRHQLAYKAEQEAANRQWILARVIFLVVVIVPCIICISVNRN
jgi:hypothetical protein